MTLFKIIFVLIFGYMAVGCYFAIRHIVGLKGMISNSLNERAVYEQMIVTHGTSPAGAEYYVALQELIIKNKEAFDEAESMKEKGWVWYVEMTIPFLIAWPHLVSIEAKTKGRDN